MGAPSDLAKAGLTIDDFHSVRMDETEEWSSFDEPVDSSEQTDSEYFGLFIDPAVIASLESSNSRDCSQLLPSAFTPKLVSSTDADGSGEARSIIHAYLKQLVSSDPKNGANPRDSTPITEDGYPEPSNLQHSEQLPTVSGLSESSE